MLSGQLPFWWYPLIFITLFINLWSLSALELIAHHPIKCEVPLRWSSLPFSWGLLFSGNDIWSSSLRSVILLKRLSLLYFLSNNVIMPFSKSHFSFYKSFLSLEERQSKWHSAQCTERLCIVAKGLDWIGLFEWIEIRTLFLRKWHQQNRRVLKSELLTSSYGLTYIWSFFSLLYLHNFVCGGSVQSLNCVLLFVTPWTAARQASLSITNFPVHN